MKWLIQNLYWPLIEAFKFFWSNTPLKFTSIAFICKWFKKFLFNIHPNYPTLGPIVRATTPAACVSPFSVQCLGSLTCIAKTQLCDGRKDCPDGADEVNCISWCEKTGTICWSLTPLFYRKLLLPLGDEGVLLIRSLPLGFQVVSCAATEQHVFPGLWCVMGETTATTAPMKSRARPLFLLLKVASTSK